MDDILKFVFQPGFVGPGPGRNDQRRQGLLAITEVAPAQPLEAVDVDDVFGQDHLQLYDKAPAQMQAAPEMVQMQVAQDHMDHASGEDFHLVRGAAHAEPCRGVAVFPCLSGNQPLVGPVLSGFLSRSSAFGQHHGVRFQQCSMELQQLTERIADQPFPDTVTYESHCGGLCHASTPGYVLKLQARVKTKLQRVIADCSRLRQVSRVCMADIFLAFDVNDQAHKPCRTVFCNVSSAAGRSGRLYDVVKF